MPRLVRDKTKKVFLFFRFDWFSLSSCHGFYAWKALIEKSKQMLNLRLQYFLIPLSENITLIQTRSWGKSMPNSSLYRKECARETLTTSVKTIGSMFPVFSTGKDSRTHIEMTKNSLGYAESYIQLHCLSLSFVQWFSQYFKKKYDFTVQLTAKSFRVAFDDYFEK